MDVAGPVVVLVEPQLGENIGMCARAMGNFGLTRLRLVKPRDGWPNVAAQRAAAGADHILDKVELFDTVEAAIADVSLLYATTARAHDQAKPVVGPEAAARDARYAALDAAAARHGAAAVLLGHTRDDQAEGVLLGLARGSGARSLAGMPAVRGVLRRPLLGLSRAETVAACAALGLDPWHDPTNDPAAGDAGAPARSRVRARVLPVLERELGPGVAAALARSADLLREDADALDALAADLLDRAAAAGAAPAAGGPPDAPDVPAPPDAPDAPGPDGTPAVLLDPAVLAAAPAALRHRALRAAAVRAGAPAGSVTRAHVAAVAALVTGGRGQGPVHLPGRVEAWRACGRLALRAASPSSGQGDVVRAGPGARRAVEPDDEGDPQR